MNPFPITLLVTEKKIFLKMPKNEADLDFVRSLRYSRWNGKVTIRKSQTIPVIWIKSSVILEIESLN